MEYIYLVLAIFSLIAANTLTGTDFDRGIVHIMATIFFVTSSICFKINELKKK